MVNCFPYLIPLISPIYALLLQPITDCKERIESLESEISSLVADKRDKLRQVEAEELNGLRRTNQMENWIERVEKLERDTRDIRALYRPRSLKVFTTYKLGAGAAKKKLDVARVKEDGKSVTLVDEFTPNRLPNMNAGPTIGMESKLEELGSLVADDSASIIGIHGMGGVGKTALLKAFAKSLRSVQESFASGPFELMLWVNVSKNYKDRSVQESIGDQLGLDKDKQYGKSDEHVQQLLLNALSNKKFLLILDDVWEPVLYDKVGIPNHLERKTGSKIIVASRKKVFNSAGLRTIKMECLKREDAWELFQSYLQDSVNSDPDIKKHAEKITKRCGGLPLALIEVGKAMGSKENVKEWKYASTTLITKPWETPGMETGVLGSLKHSYDDISSDKSLSECLVQCAMYPYHYEEGRDRVIRKFLGEGTTDARRDRGDANLDTLVSSCLLAMAGSRHDIKQHPMVHAMLCWVGMEHRSEGSKWLLLPDAELRDAPAAKEWEGAERISLMENNIVALPESPECPTLTGLNLKYNTNLAMIPHGFFQLMVRLLVLDLSNTAIEDLTDAIGCLKALQYLDVSKTKLTSLPEQLGKLRHLRFLFMNSTPGLVTIPDGVMRRFSAMERMELNKSYSGWRAGPSGGPGVDMEELVAMVKLHKLMISVANADAVEWLTDTEHRQLHSRIRKLCIRAHSHSVTAGAPNPLREIRVVGWVNVYEVMIGGGDEVLDVDLFPEVSKLSFESLPIFKMVWNRGIVGNLLHLFIVSCQSIEKLLKAKDSTIQKHGDGEIVVFPKLQTMELHNLPEFASLNVGERMLTFPCLETLVVQSCPKLKKLTLVAEKLKRVRGSREWWRQLKWEDQRTETDLNDLFEESFK